MTNEKRFSADERLHNVVAFPITACWRYIRRIVYVSPDLPALGIILQS